MQRPAGSLTGKRTGFVLPAARSILLADKLLLSDCMAIAATEPLPAEIITDSLTADCLKQIPPAVKPLALLLHLITFNMSCASSVSPTTACSNTDSTTASANDHDEHQTYAAVPADDRASMLCCLQAAQQPASQQSDTLAHQQGHTLTLQQKGRKASGARAQRHAGLQACHHS